MLPSISVLHDHDLYRGQRGPISRHFEKVMKRVSCPWQHMNNTVDCGWCGDIKPSQVDPQWGTELPVTVHAPLGLRELHSRNTAGGLTPERAQVCGGITKKYRSTVILTRCQPIVFTVSSLSVRKCADHFK